MSIRRKIESETPTSLIVKSLILLLTTLVALAIATKAFAECEGQCFSEQDARDCVQAHRKYKDCKSELVKCNKVEQENDQLAGRLNECREASKEKDKLLMHWSEKSGKLKAQNQALREQHIWYFVGGSALGIGITSLIFITAR